MVEIQNSQIEVEEHQHFNIFSTETISLGGVNVTPNTENTLAFVIKPRLRAKSIISYKKL